MLDHERKKILRKTKNEKLKTNLENASQPSRPRVMTGLKVRP
jgi:hypothetical protein